MLKLPETRRASMIGVRERRFSVELSPGSGGTRAKSERSTADRRAEAKLRGYVGDACPECSNFTLVRNGTCLKCDTCGSTTGCS